MIDGEVLICGAGPTGLVLALWLTRLGVSVRIVDRRSDAGTTSRALGIQARTLEFYRQLGLAEAVVAAGHIVPAFNFWTEGRRRARIPFGEALGRLTPHPYLLILPQDRHERLLTDRLAAMGVTVERGVELTGLAQAADNIRATLRDGDGTLHSWTARYLTGCDGARSTVRKTLGIGFIGGTYSRIFYVADIAAAGPAIDGEIHINLDTAADFLAVFPLAECGRARLIGTVLDDHPGRIDALTFADISGRAIDRLKIDVARVNWFSTYRVHHRVADRFREGRAFLLGDAGHVHSPAGGQGMNTGIGDAVNLAWKLAAVLRGGAAPHLLDSYEAERRRFARRLVATTDRIFTGATSESRSAQFWRTRIAPVAVPLVARIPAMRRFAFRTVSQIGLSYRSGPLAFGRAGRVRGGDRLPWIGSGDNFAPLATMIWQVHVYGAASAGLKTWCTANGVALHVFPAAAAVGLARDAAYLIRPDGYVALADPDADPAKIEAFLIAAGVAVTPAALSDRATA